MKVRNPKQSIETQGIISPRKRDNVYTIDSEMSTGNPKQNEFAQETKSSES